MAIPRKKRLPKDPPFFLTKRKTGTSGAMGTGRRIPVQGTLFPLKEPKVVSVATTVPEKINKYQVHLERLLDRAKYLDKLKAIMRMKKPGRRTPQKERQEYFRAVSKKKAILASLSRLGLSREEVFSLMKKRTSFLNKFYSSVRAEVNAYAKRHKIPARAVEEISNDVATWNFVDANNPGEIAFHTLIELRRFRLEKEKK